MKRSIIEMLQNLKEKTLLYSGKVLVKRYLHLHRLAVDELAAGDDGVKDDGGLLARVQDDVVALATEQENHLNCWKSMKLEEHPSHITDRLKTKA